MALLKARSWYCVGCCVAIRSPLVAMTRYRKPGLGTVSSAEDVKESSSEV